MPTAIPAAVIRAALFATVILISALAAVVARAQSGPGAVAGDGTSTRLVILLDKPVLPQLQSLTNPNRVIIDLAAPNASYPTVDKPSGLVRSVSGGVSGPNRFRVIVALSEPVIIEKPRLEAAEDGKHHRLILDFVSASSLNLAVLAKQPNGHGKTLPSTQSVVPPPPQPAKRPDELAKRAFKDLIVIDPGHGGHDTGAMRNGTVEKEVVLAFSKVLQTRLEATGRYRVLLTRDTDVFIPLDERRAFAEKNNASLFIAVHADDAQSKARGATIYSLRDTVANSLRRSAKGAASEDLVTAEELSRAERSSQSDVKGILADLANRNFDATQERSSFFSKSVIETMSEATNMHGNPEREAAFRVLKTARLPSVLIELAFVSNEQDAKLLKSEEWRRKVADSIVSAVDNYFSHQLARLPM